MPVAHLKLHNEFFFPFNPSVSHIHAVKASQTVINQAVHCILTLTLRVSVFSDLSFAFDYLGRKSNPLNVP